MNSKFFALLAAAVSVLAAPAFATHPEEDCQVRFDVAAALKAAGQDAQPVKVVFVFSGNMPEMDPQEPERISPPASGPWIYRKEVYSNLEERRLQEIKIQSAKYNQDTGKPLWTYTVGPAALSDDAAAKSAAAVCSQFAD